MPPEARKLLTDMSDAADCIIGFVAGKTFQNFAGEKLLRSGIYYQFLIIGEALARLRAVDEATVENISENWRIIGFRNQITHGYAKLDDEITWRVIETKLPILKKGN